MSAAGAEERAVRREHPPAAADALVRALATLRRAQGADERRRLRLPRDLAPFPAELWAPLAVIGQVDAVRPAEDDGRLASSLRRIARWAAERGAGDTALAFAAASAALHPALPSPALLAGCIALDSGRPALAQRWLAEAMARAAHASERVVVVAAAREAIDSDWRRLSTSDVEPEAIYPLARTAAVA
jgi:hypothetical protein